MCSAPAETEIAVVIPETEVGTSRLVPVPSPSRPDPLFPQHWTVPLARTAQVCEEPDDKDTAELTPPTWSGVALFRDPPFPS